MAEVAAAGGVLRASRLDRRKARTRQALIDAAVRLIAEGRGERASIAEITEEADIGFGSFYNHFDSKEQLFGTASGELLEQWGQVIDQACADIGDPAKVFAVSLRISGRLGWTHPDIARFLTGVGLEALDASRGLAPRALRDIQAGWRERHPEHVDEASVDQLAEACLRLLGVPASEAARLVASSLPPAGRSAGDLELLSSGQGSGLPAYLSWGAACPARTRSRVTSTPKTNPPTWAKNATPPPLAWALNNPKLPSTSW